MANKLAGQRAKFSKARAIFYSTSDDTQRHHAAELMAEVLAEAPFNDFTEDEVTQGDRGQNHQGKAKSSSIFKRRRSVRCTG